MYGTTVKLNNKAGSKKKSSIIMDISRYIFSMSVNFHFCEVAVRYAPYILNSMITNVKTKRKSPLDTLQGTFQILPASCLI